MIKKGMLVAFSGLLLWCSACKKENTVFNDVIPLQADTMILSGIAGSEAGEIAGNSVFVDLSKGVQSSFIRRNWDLGLYTGTEFRVILNHSVGATALKLDKTDMNLVTSADSTAALTTALTLGQNTTNVDPFGGIFENYLANTVIDEVSATDAENHVYMINRGGAGYTTIRKWEKVRILRNAAGNAYVVQYGDLTGDAYRTATVTKDASFNFRYFAFPGGATTIEPSKKLWDIEWTYSTYKGADGTTPVGTPDFVLINFAGGVTAAQVSISGNTTFENFSEANLDGITFSAERDIIGTSWRTINTTNTSTVNRDRFYLIKDTDGNIYKLLFNNFSTSDGGSRGRPKFEYHLVQAGL